MMENNLTIEDVEVLLVGIRKALSSDENPPIKEILNNTSIL